MKLQISFDLSNLDTAVTIASQVAPYADIIGIGTLLIYHHGIDAVKKISAACPNTIILADTKIIEYPKEIVDAFAHAGAHWLTVMAGSSTDTIHMATTSAHNVQVKIMLDLIDSNSIGQSAVEAKNLGVDALLFHQRYNNQESRMFLDEWDMIKGNTQLPIFMSAHINRNNVHDTIAIKPDTIVIGKAITHAESPEAEAQYFASLIKN